MRKLITIFNRQGATRVQLQDGRMKRMKVDRNRPVYWVYNTLEFISPTVLYHVKESSVFDEKNKFIAKFITFYFKNP